MFKYGGKSQFKDRFDFFEWSAPFYQTPEEVYKALDKAGIKGKTLAAIHAVGGCEFVGYPTLYWKIKSAGIEPGDLWWERYEHLNDVLVPQSVKLCEPIQFVFDDRTSVEILPIDDGGARIGVNSIPIGLVDGLNKSGVDANSLFRELIGKKIENIDLKEITNETRWINQYTIGKRKGNKELRYRHVIQLSFGYPCKMELVSSWESRYEVTVVTDYDSHGIAYERIESARKDQHEVGIVNGRDGGGTFWIIGTRTDDEETHPVAHYDGTGISIDDMYVEEYLAEFLCKYFDPTIQEDRYEEKVRFDWYGGNLYTFDVMREMIADIREKVVMLQNDYDNPTLDAIKAHWFYDYKGKARDQLSEKEVNELKKNVVPKAVDFYERFCDRMEKMLQIPGNNVMSFAGP